MTHSNSSTAFAALIWWVIPVLGVTGAVAYAIWTSRYKDKFENETSRSVSKFQLFQEAMRQPSESSEMIHPEAEQG